MNKPFVEYSGYTSKKPEDFLFPGRYFDALVKGRWRFPAYFYHQARQDFALICQEMVTGNFTTYTFSDLLNDVPIGKERALILSFDDGWSSVWSIAFPLAQEHGTKFTLFINPQTIEESEECRSTIDDGADIRTLIARDQSSRNLLTWGEIKAMYHSGLVDVQSHSLHHGLVFASDRLCGFVAPDNSFPSDGNVGLVSYVNERNTLQNPPALGTPLYQLGPALAVPRRFIEDSEVRRECVTLVQENGGASFFVNAHWKDTLRGIVDRATRGRWESESQRYERLRDDLLQARLMIQEHLPGAQVRVLAPPWAVMHHDIPAIAKETGYEMIALGYPFNRQMITTSPLPLYPRLYGDGVWVLLQGFFKGAIGWWRARRRNFLRRAQGEIP